MRAPALQRNSWLRYASFEESDYAGNSYSFFDVVAFPTIETQDDDRTHTVTSADRPDLLADRFYGDSRLWWVLAIANGWDQPFTALCPGTVISVPSPRYVRERLVK